MQVKEVTKKACERKATESAVEGLNTYRCMFFRLLRRSSRMCMRNPDG